VVELDEEVWLVLHEVRLRGVADLDPGHPAIDRLLATGFVSAGPRGVRVTVDGRAAHTTWARLSSGSDDEATARRAYERFLPLNRELIRICNDWQVRPGGVPNDHRDARYDWSVLDRLHAIDERVGPVASRLGRGIERFARYRSRLRDALTRVDDGDVEWLNSPRFDSYHTVWMQLHEDLLLALGADRASEPPVEDR
jgi:hypothetical protein